jgi:hypothetical protein
LKTIGSRRQLIELDWRVESQLPLGHSHGKFVVEEELEVSLRKLSVGIYMCYNYRDLECVRVN